MRRFEGEQRAPMIPIGALSLPAELWEQDHV